MTYTQICNFLSRLGRDDRGQDLIEYALLGAFVSLVGITGAGLLGTALNAWYVDVGGNIQVAAQTAGS